MIAVRHGNSIVVNVNSKTSFLLKLEDINISITPEEDNEKEGKKATSNVIKVMDFIVNELNNAKITL